MLNTDPPSPAASQPRPDATATDLSNGFQQLVSYNQSVPHQRQVQSQSPFELHQQHHGLPNPYGSYTPVEEYPDTPAYYSSVYPELPHEVSSSIGPSTPQSFSHSPPIVTGKRYPLRHTDSDPLRGSQSAGVSKHVSKPKAKGRPRSRKKKSDNAERTYKFAKPLSEMCNEVTEVQDADIEAWVTRSTAVRREERENTKQKRIKRPMNAFMLYRKAHQLRVKHLWSHENHQIVSAVCGDGWATEDESVIAQYNEWARIERDNHAVAFPNYKFAPAKPKKAKRAGGGESDDEFEMPDIFGGLGAGPAGMHTRAMSSMSADHSDADYRPTRRVAASVYSPSQAAQPLPQGRAVAHYSYQSAGKPLPMGYGGDLGHHEYYRQEVARYDPALMHHRGLHQMPPGYHDQAAIENLYMTRPSPTPVMGHNPHISYPSYSAHGTPAPPEPFAYPPPHAPAAMPVHHHHHQPPPPPQEPSLYLEPSLYGHEGDIDDFNGGGLGIFHDHFDAYGPPESPHYASDAEPLHYASDAEPSHFVDAGPYDPTPPPSSHDEGLLDATLHTLDPALQGGPPPLAGGGGPDAGHHHDAAGHHNGDAAKWDTAAVEPQGVSYAKLDRLLDDGTAAASAAGGEGLPAKREADK